MFEVNFFWRHLFLTKQSKNPYEEGCYTGEDLENVKRKWEAKKEYFSQYKKDGCRPPCIDLAMAIQGFNIDNTAAYHAIEYSKALHARRWQTKEGMYRIKTQALPDVRDEPLHDDNAAASSMPNRDGEAGMKTMLRDINVISNGTGQEIPYASSWSSTYESIGPLGTFHSFSPPVSPPNDTCRFLACFVVCMTAYHLLVVIGLFA